MAKDTRLTFRISSELKKNLETIAAREARSVAQISEAILNDGVLTYQREGSKYMQRIISSYTKQWRANAKFYMKSERTSFRIAASLIVLQSERVRARDFHSSCRAARLWKSLWLKLRMKFSVGSVESQPAGIPLLRVASLNTRCFDQESRAAGCALFLQRTLRCRVGTTPRLYYKDFAGTKPACVRNESGFMLKEGKSFMPEVKPVVPGPQFAAFVASIGQIRNMCGVYKQPARSSARAASWSIGQKR